jgi:hypothetical protein
VINFESSGESSHWIWSHHSLLQGIYSPILWSRSTVIPCKSMHYHYLATTHFSTTHLTGRGRHQFSRQQPAMLGVFGFHGTTSECRSPNSAASTTPPLTYKSCPPPQSLAMLHPQILGQIPPDKQIYKSTIHFLENNPKSYYTPKPIRWGATPSPNTARAPAPAATAAAAQAAPATRQSPTDTTTSKQAYKSSAS